jgi:hypothetical protein
MDAGQCGRRGKSPAWQCFESDVKQCFGSHRATKSNRHRS